MHGHRLVRVHNLCCYASSSACRRERKSGGLIVIRGCFVPPSSPQVGWFAGFLHPAHLAWDGVAAVGPSALQVMKRGKKRIVGWPCHSCRIWRSPLACFRETAHVRETALTESVSSDGPGDEERRRQEGRREGQEKMRRGDDGSPAGPATVCRIWRSQLTMVTKRVGD